MIRKLLLIFTASLVAQIAVAQTPQEREIIKSATSPAQQLALRQEIQELVNQNKKEVAQYLQENPAFAKSLESDKQERWLERIDSNGNPVFLVPHNNFVGARTIRVNSVQDNGELDLDLKGQGMKILIWDGGYARGTHEGFSGRVTYGEQGKSESDHGTHVAGTMIASGPSFALQGMAPDATLISFRFDDDVTEMEEEASEGFLISNHSYGSGVDEDTPKWYYGRYDGVASLFDNITNTFPYYLPVVSAGNDRGAGLNFDDKGFDLLTDRSTAKNVITVGAVESVFNYRQASDVRMSNFSSFGPTDDGRIKPDIVAMGVSVISLSSSSDTASSIKSGTSMSAPMVSGGLMLLHQLYNEQESSFMKASTVRGLALMTTREAGDFDGPDYRFGWGLLDVEAAAKLILGLNESSTIMENALISGNSYEQTFVTKASERISFALSWTDLPGDPLSNDAPEDDNTPMLINDLDIKVVSMDGTEYFPYKLDGANPEKPATNGINDVDNIEIIHIDAPAGNYRVEITHKGTLEGDGPQAYSLLVNGATPQTASTGTDKLDSLSIFPNPANNSFNVSLDATAGSDSIDIQVFNTLGQRVIEKSFKNNGRFNERIDISGINSGVYFVKVQDGNLSSTRKLIVR